LSKQNKKQFSLKDGRQSMPIKGHRWTRPQKQEASPKLKAPSSRGSLRSPRSSVTIKEHEVDTLGAFPPAEPTDFELALINDLLERYGDLLRTFVFKKRKERAASSKNNSKQRVLWPKFVCRTHGDGVPWGHSFDRLIRRCETSEPRVNPQEARK